MGFFTVVGEIGTPNYLQNNGYGDLTGTNGSGGGLVGLISNIVKLIIVIGGLWSFINLILAGFAYISNSGKPEELEKAHSKIFMSLIGLLVMVGSFVLAGIFGYLLFGDASAILSPKIYGPGN